MKIAIYENATGIYPAVVDPTWSELVEALLVHDRRSIKDGRAWSPVEHNACPPDRCLGTNPKTRCEGGVVHRIDESVACVTAFVADLDHVSDEQLEAIDLEGYAYVIHSTFRHSEDDQSYRLVLPLSRAVLPHEWKAVRTAVIQKFKLPADPRTGNLSRIYYEPSARPGAPTVADTGEGEPINVDELQTRPAETDDPAELGQELRAPSGQHEGGRKSSAVPDLGRCRGPESPVDLDAARKQLRHVKPESQEIARRILAGEALADLGGHDDALQKACSIVYTTCRLPWPAALELMRPSFIATGWGDGLDHMIAQGKLKYDRAVARFEQWKKERDEEAARLRQALTGKARDIPRRDPEAPTEGIGDEWERALAVTVNKDGELKFLPTASNVGMILEHSWPGAIRYNDLTKAIEITDGPLADAPPSTLHTAGANWLARSEWRINVQSHVVAEQLLEVARRNPYDPLKAYLEPLKWDGTPRLDTALERHFGAVMVGAEGEDITAYVRAVSAKWMIGAVARGLDPGCKVDNVLILEGEQGIRKSTALRVLSEPYFCDEPIAVGDKDSLLKIARTWIAELAELETFKRSESEAKKAFFSRPTDLFRVPFGRVVEEHPRHCVFVGTTNNDDYLSDLSGNRRYWPVRCEKVDVAALKADRDQLWAEAVVRYRAGEPWWLEGELEKGAAAQTEARTMGAQAWQEAILTWWQDIPLSQREPLVSLHTVAEHALKLTAKDLQRGLEIQIGRVLKDLGFERTRRRVEGVLKYLYAAPEHLLNAPRVLRTQPPKVASHG